MCIYDSERREKEGGGKWHLFSEMMHPSSASVVKSRYEKVSTADRFAQLPPLARCYSQIQEVLEDVSFKTQLESERLMSRFEKTMQEHEIHRMHEELTRFHGINCAASYQGSRRKCCDGVKANVDFFAFSSSSYEKGGSAELGLAIRLIIRIAFPFQPVSSQDNSISSFPP